MARSQREWISGTAGQAAAKVLTDNYGVDDEDVPTDAIGALLARGWTRVSFSDRPYDSDGAVVRASEIYEETVAPVIAEVDEIIAELCPDDSH